MTPRGTRRLLHGLDRRLVAIGGCGGVLSGLLGVGGGTLMVPFLTLAVGMFAAFLALVSVRLVRDSLGAQ